MTLLNKCSCACWPSSVRSLTLTQITLALQGHQLIQKLVSQFLECLRQSKAYVYLSIPFIFDFQEDLDFKMPWRKRGSPFSSRLSQSSVNRSARIVGILRFRQL